MATGDQGHVADLIRRLLPSGWFKATAVLDAVVAGTTAVWTNGYDAVAYLRQQLRLATATDGNLDVICTDFLGDRFFRAPGETDDHFRIRLRREILRAKVTRQALSDALQDLTGYKPLIFEPRDATDTGGWGAAGRTGFAYGAAGGWGSRARPYQVFVTAYRPIGGGPPGISGWDQPQGGWHAGAFAMQSQSALRQGITDDIRECCTSVVSAGTVVWLRIAPPPVAGSGAGNRLNADFILDISRLS